MPQALFLIYVFALGLCFGSFANVVIYRLPKGISIVLPPSHCPSCNTRLTGRDLIPLISYICLLGRCRSCGARISLRYPTVELLCGLLFFSMAFYAGVSLSAIPLCLLCFILLCVSIVDLDIQEIPDGLLIFGTAVAVCWVAASALFPGIFASIRTAPVWHDAILGALAGASPLFIFDRATLLILKKDGFGFGDVKLMAMAGLFLGWKLALVSLLFAFLTGGLYAAFLLLTRRASKGTYLAFGPFLSIGVYAALWLGEWYLGVLGF